MGKLVMWDSDQWNSSKAVIREFVKLNLVDGYGFRVSVSDVHCAIREALEKKGVTPPREELFEAFVWKALRERFGGYPVGGPYRSTITRDGRKIQCVMEIRWRIEKPIEINPKRKWPRFSCPGRLIDVDDWEAGHVCT